MKRILAIVAVLVAGSALAIQQLDLNLSQRLQALTGGILLGPLSVNPTDARINANRITRSLGASSTINFSATHANTAGAANCSESSAITVLGARTGDACHVGPPVLTASDGGVLSGNFSCFVSASDAVKVRFCGSDDPASGTFYVRVISSQ